MSDSVAIEIHVEIRLFGTVEVRVDGHELPRLNSRRALWLLADLALRNGRPIERSRLAGLLWPDSLDTSALHNLRQTLSDLRRALGPAARILEADTPRSIRLKPHCAEIDVLAFDSAVADGSPLALERAANLYRGPLLEGCDEPWAAEARASREQAYLKLLEGLAAFHAGREEHAAAADYLRRAIQTDPYRESAYRALMEAQAAKGEFASAVEVYRELRLRLQRDLNSEPDAATVAIYSAIKFRASNPNAGGARPARRLGRLPRPLTEMVGREQEIQNVSAFLQRCRMVTLTGVGGIGETRLAIAVAEQIRDRYPDGAWFVDLAPIVDVPLLPKAVASALGVREQPDRELIETMAEVISDKCLLLIVDNCEHMVHECAGLLETLLSMSPRLTVLATSRQNLGVIGELAWQAPGLSLPASPHAEVSRDENGKTATTFMQSEAVRLFVERARHATPGWEPSTSALEAIADMCRRLDGIPLAIELAAARAKSLSPRDILARLEDRFSLLTQGSRAIARHQTLRAAMDWSYDLLAPAEQILLGRLSVFAGGWTLDAAQHVGAGDPIDHADVADLLTGLADKSLIVFEVVDESPRYHMLETVREYARDRLREIGAGTNLHARFVSFFLELAEEAAPNLHRPEQAAWMDRLEAEHDNLRATFQLSLEATRQGEEQPTDAGDPSPTSGAPAQVALRLAGALLRFWMVRGHYGEGRAWLATALWDPDAQARTEARAIALNAAGALARDQGDYAAAWSFHEESLAINRERGDAARISTSLTNLAIVAVDRGDYVKARPLYERALAIDREIGDLQSEGGSLSGLGMLAYMEADYGSAQSYWEQALLISRELGDRGWEALNLGNLGETARKQGDLSIARSYLEQARTINRELGERSGEARDLNNLGRVAAEQGLYDEARSLYRHAIAIRRELDLRGEMAWSLEAFASLAAAEGDFERAARLWGAAATLRASLSSPISPGDREEYDRSVSVVRRRLGEKAFTSAFESGGAMDLDRAVVYARSS